MSAPAVKREEEEEWGKKKRRWAARTVSWSTARKTTAHTSSNSESRRRGARDLDPKNRGRRDPALPRAHALRFVEVLPAALWGFPRPRPGTSLYTPTHSGGVFVGEPTHLTGAAGAAI